jgi:hypothetical protein
MFIKEPNIVRIRDLKRLILAMWFGLRFKPIQKMINVESRSKMAKVAALRLVFVALGPFSVMWKSYTYLLLRQILLETVHNFSQKASKGPIFSCLADIII